MSAVRRQVAVSTGGKIPFDCPGCGIRLMMDPAYPATSGPCPSCGGWIRPPQQMRAMPVAGGGEVKLESPRKVPFQPKVASRGAAGEARITGVSPDVVCDSTYEARKEMKGFYRFLGAVGLAVCVCLAAILWVTRS